jgi:hypothetical protein
VKFQQLEEKKGADMQSTYNTHKLKFHYTISTHNSKREIKMKIKIRKNQEMDHNTKRQLLDQSQNLGIKKFNDK